MDDDLPPCLKPFAKYKMRGKLKVRPRRKRQAFRAGKKPKRKREEAAYRTSGEPEPGKKAATIVSLWDNWDKPYDMTLEEIAIEAGCRVEHVKNTLLRWRREKYEQMIRSARMATQTQTRELYEDIKMAMEERGMTVEKLAKKSGVDRKTIWSWLRGVRDPSVVNICAMAHTLELRVRALSNPPSRPLGSNDQYKPLLIRKRK